MKNVWIAISFPKYFQVSLFFKLFSRHFLYFLIPIQYTVRSILFAWRSWPCHVVFIWCRGKFHANKIKRMVHFTRIFFKNKELFILISKKTQKPVFNSIQSFSFFSEKTKIRKNRQTQQKNQILILLCIVLSSYFDAKKI